MEVVTRCPPLTEAVRREMPWAEAELAVPAGDCLGGDGTVGVAGESALVPARVARAVDPFEDCSSAWGGVCSDTAYLSALASVADVAKATKMMRF